MPRSFAPCLKPIAIACICMAAFQSLPVIAQQTPTRPLAPTVDNLRGPTAPYIVTLNPDRLLTPFNENVRDDRFALRPREWGYLNRRVVGDVQRYERKYGFQAVHVYSRALMGFSASLTEAQVRALSREGSVFTVEPDLSVQTTQLRLPALGGLLPRPPAPTPAPSPSPAPVPAPSPEPSPVPPPVPAGPGPQNTPYGIEATGARNSWSIAGNGRDDVGPAPTIYVIDSGVANHPDLNVSLRINFAGGVDDGNDCNGHGTHVTGTAAARDNTIDVVGVAPGVKVVAVKVFDCSGSGPTSNVIKGVDWVTANAAPGLSVVNMSLGGSINTALDNAVRTSAAEGILYTIAAGNNGLNACNYSPARLGNATANVLVVAATDEAGREADFSNTGRCVDIWAPGVGVVSTNRAGGVSLLSGTSMAAPHVAGAAALIIGLARRDNRPAPSATEVRTRLRSTATPTNQTGKSTLLGDSARPVMLLNANIN